MLHLPLVRLCWLSLVAATACDPGSPSKPASDDTAGWLGSGGTTGIPEKPTWDTHAALGGGDGNLSVAHLPAPVQPWQPSTACLSKVAERLALMSWPEKFGQMVQGDSRSTTPDDVVKYNLGSVLSGGGSDPATDDALAWANLVSRFTQAGQALSAPILYGIDAVHGHNNVSDAVIFPHNIGLGCTRDAELVEAIGQATASEMRGTGMHWAFAPVVAAGRDERWGRTYETFSESPELAATLGVAAIRGLQGAALSNDPTHVLACAKHFAGDGSTDRGIDQGNVSLSEPDFRRLAVEQYQPAINAGVGSIMVSYSSYQGLKMSAQGYWLTDVLKGEMGFQGFLVSDWQALQQLPPAAAIGSANPPPSEGAVVTAINAGLDMIMEPTAFPAVIASLASAHAAGKISDARIDDAVSRILTVKCEMGLLDEGYLPNIDPTLTAGIGSSEHMELARRAVRESLVLLKNDGSVLPLRPDARVLVV
ncbi:MAG TPA: glycoside hydrolase family 3 protein, partial [Polyangiaceae bacterium]